MTERSAPSIVEGVEVVNAEPQEWTRSISERPRWMSLVLVIALAFRFHVCGGMRREWEEEKHIKKKNLFIRDSVKKK
jgi:hypothetical protein